MLQQQKKQFQSYFAFFRALSSSYQQLFSPVDNIEKSPAGQRLATALFLSKRFRKGLKNIF
jgi:hypothetical protein